MRNVFRALNANSNTSEKEIQAYLICLFFLEGCFVEVSQLVADNVLPDLK